MAIALPPGSPASLFFGKASLHGHDAGGFSPVAGGCWLTPRGVGVVRGQLPSHTVKLQHWHQLWLCSWWFCLLRAERSGKGKHP